MSVHAFPGTVLSVDERQEPNQAVIDALQSLLMRAQSGELQTLAYVCLGVNVRAFGHFTESKDDVFNTLGVMQCLEQKMAQGMFDDE